MAELSKEQIELAAKAYEASGKSAGLSVALLWPDQRRDALRAAAPYLQLPWDEPSGEEVETCYREISGSNGPSPHNIDSILNWFVRRRNAALLPKPVDPRREKIEAILGRHIPDGTSQTIERILTALDEANSVKGIG